MLLNHCVTRPNPNIMIPTPYRLSVRLRYLLVVFAFTVTACAPQQVRESSWPGYLPLRSYFLAVYEQDETNKQQQTEEEYLAWVVRYYEGWEFYPRGWNQIAQEIVQAQKEPKAVDNVKAKLQSLGLLISAEWAKNNRTRLIHTRQVALWANAMATAIAQGETLKLLDMVLSDVKAILAGKLTAEAIGPSRYDATDSASVDDPL